jgi:uncharacterized membrane protein YesL
MHSFGLKHLFQIPLLFSILSLPGVHVVGLVPAIYPTGGGV